METLQDYPKHKAPTETHIVVEPEGEIVSITVSAEGSGTPPTQYQWPGSEFGTYTPYRFSANTRFPPGVHGVEYRWDFGDGIVRYGPNVTHTYKVASPDTVIQLCVRDSLRRKTCVLKTFKLRKAGFGQIIAAPKVLVLSSE